MIPGTAIAVLPYGSTTSHALNSTARRAIRGECRTRLITGSAPIGDDGRLANHLDVMTSQYRSSTNKPLGETSNDRNVLPSLTVNPTVRVRRAAGTLKEWCGCIDPQARRQSAINLQLDREIGVAVDTTRRANRRHATREVQARATLAVPGPDAAVRSEEMLMDHHETGDHRLSSAIDDERIPWDDGGHHVTDPHDRTMTNDDRLVRLRRRTGAINHAHIANGDDGCVRPQVLRERIGAASARLRGEGRTSGNQSGKEK